MTIKLKSSSPLEVLREQVRAQALQDSRFNKGATVVEIFQPNGRSAWGVILQASDARLFELPFTIEAGVVKLSATSREVFRSVRYLPLAATLAQLPVALQARDFSTEVKLDQPWMFAPGGVHKITCGAGDGGSAEVVLRIDKDTAVILNAKLAEMNSKHSPQRAFIDKEHDAAAGATAWPEKLFWSDSPVPGIYLASEPSELGKELVGGKVIRAFSPSFYSDADLPKRVGKSQHVKIQAGKRGSVENPARMIGLVFPACGTLTNNPAFRKILPLWAKNAPGATKSR
jgi:hypothetical protein